MWHMKHMKVSPIEKTKNSSHRVKKKKISTLHVQKKKKILHPLKSPPPKDNVSNDLSLWCLAFPQAAQA